MACYWLNQHDVNVAIPTVEENNSVIYYNIAVAIADVHWKVAHRYNEFFELHNVLVFDHGASKDALPAKKVFGSKTPEFIEARRVALEEYLQTMLKYLTRTMPAVFVEFLHMHLYDVFYLLQSIASGFYMKTDAILSSKKGQLFNPLELHAIGKCLKSPFPQIQETSTAKDLSNVFEVCSQLKSLQIEGKDQHIMSNICPNKLEVDLSPFKAVELLTITKYNFENVSVVGSMRQTLRVLTVHHTTITSIAQVLQCDNIHKNSITAAETWPALTKIDLSSNRLAAIDASIRLAPHVETLVVDDNDIEEIADLSSLTHLRSLYASNNRIASCADLHRKLGNVSTLHLSQNRIARIGDLARMYALETLVLSANRIDDAHDLASVGELPCLEHLTLTGNPVSTVIDYRVKVLQHFGERARELCLDNERPLQAEVDKALVLRALQMGKEGKFVAAISK